MSDPLAVVDGLLTPLAMATRLLLESLSVLTVLYGLLAMEFQLAADIVSTTIAPSQANLIQLAAVAVIRTFLNLFLAREIQAEQPR
jgi:uncharacterized membrane protein